MTMEAVIISALTFLVDTAAHAEMDSFQMKAHAQVCYIDIMRNFSYSKKKMRKVTSS